MKNIQYVGLADARHITVEDFERIGASYKEDLEFAQGETKELSNEISEVLLSHDTFLGEFLDTTEGDSDEEDADTEADEAKKKAEADAAAGATSQTGTGTTGASGSRGRGGNGSSTAGSAT